MQEQTEISTRKRDQRTEVVIIKGTKIMLFRDVKLSIVVDRHQRINGTYHSIIQSNNQRL
jgi:hypothetical protein